MSVCECCCVFMHTFWLAASFGWNCMFCVSLFNVAYLWLTFKYVSVNNIFFCSLLLLLCIYTCSLWSFFACAHVFGFYILLNAPRNANRANMKCTHNKQTKNTTQQEKQICNGTSLPTHALLLRIECTPHSAPKHNWATVEAAQNDSNTAKVIFHFDFFSLRTLRTQKKYKIQLIIFVVFNSSMYARERESYKYWIFNYATMAPKTKIETVKK